MKLFQPPKSFVLVLIAAAIPALCYAQDKAKNKEKPAKLTPEELKIAKPSGIPSPIALFKAFDDIQGIDWEKAAAEIAKEPALERTTYGSDTVKVALNIGTRIADALFAIQAKDTQLLRDASNSAIELSKTFNLQMDLAKSRDDITSLAEKKDWNQVAQATQDVSDMIERKLTSADEGGKATLAAIGGWLRGLELITGMLATEYSEKGGSLLRQGELMAAMKERLEKLDSSSKDNPMVREITAQVGKIEELTAVPKGKAVSKENVAKLHEISAQLVRTIENG